MSSVDVVDETFIVAPQDRVAAEFADPGVWRRYWPDLELSVQTDRGERGIRWTVRGAMIGSMEVWLEQVLDGTVLHYYLRADPVGPDGRPAPLHWRKAMGEVSRRQRAAKAIALELKDRLEGGRAPGEPPVAVPARPEPSDSAPPTSPPLSAAPPDNPPQPNGPRQPDGSAGNGAVAPGQAGH